MEAILQTQVIDSQADAAELPKYEAPAVIYEGLITTRAGSPVGSGPDVVDPADLFGN